MAGWQGACGPEASIVGQDGAAAGKAETWAENAPGAPPAPAGRLPGGGGSGDGPTPRRASLRGLKSRIIVGKRRKLDCDLFIFMFIDQHFR